MSTHQEAYFSMPCGARLSCGLACCFVMFLFLCVFLVSFIAFYKSSFCCFYLVCLLFLVFLCFFVVFLRQYYLAPMQASCSTELAAEPHGRTRHCGTNFKISGQCFILSMLCSRPQCQTIRGAAVARRRRRRQC